MSLHRQFGLSLTRSLSGVIALVALSSVALSSCAPAPNSIADRPSPAVASPAIVPPAPTSSTPAPRSPFSLLFPPKSATTRAIEDTLKSNLAQQIGSVTRVETIACPNQDKLEVGTTIACTVKISQGTFPAIVTFKNADGQFSIKTQRLLLLNRVETSLIQAIKQSNQVSVKADCGQKVKLFQKPGEQFSCKLTSDTGKNGTATLTLTNLEGNVDAKWQL